MRRYIQTVIHSLAPLLDQTYMVESRLDPTTKVETINLRYTKESESSGIQEAS